ncbi:MULTISPECIES: hypothetical protein [Burkholderia]|uniref:hypothetical protein n=1 Tax=Burkholderia TaxID=32008 RepID=UPI000B7A8FEB|nr:MULTISPECIES: hypothetical protein [Burkholderia]MBY4725717.1 hypothetical protein [Burkholderia contaminans]MCI3969255.1 hypothetical protein [Burkholderia sp. HI4860]OXI98488.1 hypothetical protein CFB48_24120 [Burkholderia sp. AU33647]
MIPFQSFCIRTIGLIVLALALLGIGTYAVHKHNQNVIQTTQLKDTNVALKADAAKASSATEVAVKKLQQLDTITQEKARSEQSIHEDNTQFHRELAATSGQDVDAKRWIAEPVPTAVARSLCERTAVSSSDCHRDQDGSNPEKSHHTDAASGVPVGN